MSSLQPKGEKIRQAIKWISSERMENEKKGISTLIQEASLRFNLSPKEEAFLISFYSEKEEKS